MTNLCNNGSNLESLVLYYSLLSTSFGDISGVPVVAEKHGKYGQRDWNFQVLYYSHGQNRDRWNDGIMQLLCAQLGFIIDDTSLFAILSSTIVESIVADHMSLNEPQVSDSWSSLLPWRDPSTSSSSIFGKRVIPQLPLFCNRAIVSSRLSFLSQIYHRTRKSYIRHDRRPSKSLIRGLSTSHYEG